MSHSTCVDNDDVCGSTSLRVGHARNGSVVHQPEVERHHVGDTGAWRKIAVVTDTSTDVLEVLAKRLGHSSPRITMEVYSHVDEGMDDEAAAKLGAVFLGGDAR